MIQLAENDGKTVIEYESHHEMSEVYINLAKKIMED